MKKTELSRLIIVSLVFGNVISLLINNYLLYFPIAIVSFVFFSI